MSTKEVRLATVLREMPYAIAFSQRVHLFHNLVARDKEDHQGDRVNFLQGKAIHVHIRRNFIYEDAFEKLSSDNGKTNYLLSRLPEGVNQSSLSKLFLLHNFMNIDGTTLKSFFWFLRLSAGPQKLEHKVDHINYFTV